ncbi:MAG: 30S ribosomal protein S2 [Planctomycetota bacterium]|nr:30S ribosomal protein S2 [Planctomycetota bacterium]MEE2883882.1 30S ribosomal protein S2 [Planctomycetota bacterium]
MQIQELIEAGVHFGHRSSRWHPAMAPYIHQKHNKIHVIDLRETVRGIVRAQHFLENIVEAGHDIVFVGTKSQAREVVREQSARCGMHFCVHRWLGGTLTNYQTIRSRLRRLEELEKDLSDEGVSKRGKKEIARMERERRKIFRNLEGVRNMNRLPGALIAVDVRRDEIAVKEARKRNIPVIGIVDTDCDPSLVDIVIPGNDDAFRSIEVILSQLVDSIIAGKDKLTARQQADAAKKAAEEIKTKVKEKERNTDLKEARSKPYNPPQPAPGVDEAPDDAQKPKIVVTPDKNKTEPAPQKSDEDAGASEKNQSSS